jgi:hypothetical protein
MWIRCVLEESHGAAAPWKSKPPNVVLRGHPATGGRSPGGGVVTGAVPSPQETTVARATTTSVRHSAHCNNYYYSGAHPRSDKQATHPCNSTAGVANEQFAITCCLVMLARC